MDKAIEKAVIQQKAILALHWQWMLDSWKDSLGMLEYAPTEPTEEDRYFREGEVTRKLWNRKPVHGPRSEPYRMLPLFNGYCRLVRDKR